jgi:Ubiquitin-binding domain
MLHRQRTEFWETAPQYDGLVDSWNTLRVAVELSHQNDLSTAQAVLNSAGITVPTGDLGHGCYDELGHRFVLPDFVLSEPSNILDDEVELKPRDSSSTAVMKNEIEAIDSPGDQEPTYSVTYPCAIPVLIIPGQG